MSVQHLSDEAVAAFADGVLRGHARERAGRHVDTCAECRAAVCGQREAAWALRAATSPAPPTDLMARLRGLPQTTPLTVLPTVLAPDGSTMLATFAPVVAFVADTGPRTSRARPYVATAAAVALAGSLIAGSVAQPAESTPGRGSVPRSGAGSSTVPQVSVFEHRH